MENRILSAEDLVGSKTIRVKTRVSGGVVVKAM